VGAILQLAGRAAGNAISDATAETTLFDVKTHRIVWTATSQTFNPTSVQQEAPGLADAVIRALQARA
jgi:hypothetical protein